MFLSKKSEHSACGVGFISSRSNTPSHSLLQQALHALRCVEHRGACGADNVTGDGAGIMTDIPFEMLGYQPGEVAVATLFMPTKPDRLRLALKVFEETFGFMGLQILDYRDVPIDLRVLGEEGRLALPTIKHAFIRRPRHCRTDESFNKLLYAAKQATRTKERARGIIKEFFFTSLSTTTIVYKGLLRAEALDRFYLDLRNPAFRTRFALFHRRFSTNTRTSWDKAQPFRLIGHNGEINTIAGNRSWSYSREQSLGLPVDELLTHESISDSGSLNEMVEALKYRSSIPRVEDILAIMMPPAAQESSFYKFWSRAMEPWDGPAFITYSDGETIGARLDRNGFRPCRWTMTEEHFYLCSEAGSFRIDESEVLAKGALHAGTGVTVELSSGAVHFEDPGRSRENYDARLDARLERIEIVPHADEPTQECLNRKRLFRYTQEDWERILLPMIAEGKEAIGSMGDTARPAVLSAEPRPFFDYFYQDFAQVTNPPLDYLREALVTDLETHVGPRPNIFAPKELIPPAKAIELASPLLSLGQISYFRRLPDSASPHSRMFKGEIPMRFDRQHGGVGLRSALKRIGSEAVRCVERGASVLVLSDRTANHDHPPLPSLLALRAAVNALNAQGISLNASILVDTAEARRSHDVAALIGFGATAVCPYLALQLARAEADDSLEGLDADQREKNLLRALESGLLKIMSKMGISVIRSYQGSQLFTALGLGAEIVEAYFPKLACPIGGIGIEYLAERILRETIPGNQPPKGGLANTYQFKEHNRGSAGERHSMTNARSRLIHKIVRESGLELSDTELYREYLKHGEAGPPVNIRHLFEVRRAATPLAREAVEPPEAILRRFGSGAMSFGAISAESQRDIILAMRMIGGRSNSGEGGENPYYYEDGTVATIKQVASGRFGVTAEYLISGKEYQIKIAQGAKPGEGGQLMGIKVTPEIARARHSSPEIDLISPPPQHDIYSIEDLKELIYELKQLNAAAAVSVKLVSGVNIGTISVGVAKAGADVIHIAGHDGGTGAAPLGSMKHAGLPWELGLAEVHRALVANGLRDTVTLRVDGGLHSGRDIVIAALLGAEEYEFGKLLLIAQGCVMARICEKNTCPTGIATHDPKFKAKYKGDAHAVAALLRVIADDVRRQLAEIGASKLDELIGRGDLLQADPRHAELMEERGIDLSSLLDGPPPATGTKRKLYEQRPSPLNAEILSSWRGAVSRGEEPDLALPIRATDRAALATLSGALAEETRLTRMQALQDGAGSGAPDSHRERSGRISLSGSAGQGFCFCLVEGLDVRLTGEANDSVCKSMSGGRVVIVPALKSSFDPAENTIIGNCALYGATGGKLFVHGLAGDRFGVRNSGAKAVIEGAGLHACEYMTSGTVAILGKISHNVGAGMTGGALFLLHDYHACVNEQYLGVSQISGEEELELRLLLLEHHQQTGSRTAERYLADWSSAVDRFRLYLPIRELARRAKRSEEDTRAA